MSLTGALTPAGLGMSCLIPLIENGFVDWMVSTGANLYHDTHFGLGLKMFQGSAEADDVALHKAGVVRIYDIFFDYRVLLSTDAFFRQIARQEEFQHPMSSAEFHYRAGRYVAERERVLKLHSRSLLAAAHEYAVPIYTSSPGDSSIGMNLALLEIEGYGLRLDPLADVNETAAIVYAAKAAGMKSAVFILGGGSPKNFVLQTEPQIQEVMGVAEKGHDYFLQVTDARPDTGGLSGATPVGGGELGQDRSRSPARLGGLLCRLHGRAAADHRLRAGAPQAAQAAAPVRRARDDDDAAAHGLRARAAQAAAPGRVVSECDEENAGRRACARARARARGGSGSGRNPRGAISATAATRSAPRAATIR